MITNTFNRVLNKHAYKYQNSSDFNSINITKVNEGHEQSIFQIYSLIETFLGIGLTMRVLACLRNNFILIPFFLNNLISLLLLWTLLQCISIKVKM